MYPIFSNEILFYNIRSKFKTILLEVFFRCKIIKLAFLADGSKEWGNIFIMLCKKFGKLCSKN